MVSVVEMDAVLICGMVSMGPRPGGHGKERIPVYVFGNANQFQWGHDPEVMVSIAPPYTVAITEYTFQWGHDPEVMVR